MLERLYDDRMGNPNLRREAMRARSAYLGAVHRLLRALKAFSEARVPLEPDAQGGLAPWTARHVAVMRECAEAWPAVVERRRAYDTLLRDLGEPGPGPRPEGR
jgi:hypothetical protein